MFLLEQHQLADSQIYDKCTSEEVAAAMAATNAKFVMEQSMLHEAKDAARNEVLVQPDADAAASSASYVPPSNFRGRVWLADSYGPYKSIIDLMSINIGDGHVTDSSEND